MKLITRSTLFAIVAATVVGCSQNPPDSAQNGQPPAANKPAETQTSATPTDKGTNVQLVDFTNEKGELVCPVSGDVVASKEKAEFADHDGKRYYFCCAACPPEFKKDPDKYADGKAIKSGESKSMH